jgi:hypothetical protein
MADAPRQGVSPLGATEPKNCRLKISSVQWIVGLISYVIASGHIRFFQTFCNVRGWLPATPSS